MLEPQVLVVFGASGDLAHRKLVPALYSLHVQGGMPVPMAILGVGRTSLDDDSFKHEMSNALAKFASTGPGHHHAPHDDSFFAKLHYLSMDTGNANEYSRLKVRIGELCKEMQIPENVVFYLAVPPELSESIPSWLADQNLHNEDAGFKRIVVEKPFGHDLASARALNRSLLLHWKESQIYRIDHYLGKETVQNLLVFRFSNEIFDSLWNHRYVDYVEITAAESLGVESRAGYFERAGIVRDMIQNHLLQVLAMVAMDPPINFDASCVRNETMKVFKSLRPWDAQSLAENVVFGQYISSHIKGQQVPGYRQEKGIPEDSRTETFAALKVFVDHPRWYNVPFYLRTGKRLPTRVSEVVIHFKKTPHPAFGVRGDNVGQNQLVIRIQPDEGILLKVGLKEPGAGFHVKTINMDFHYSNLANVHVPESYERLLLDVMQGDATLYSLGDAVETCWQFIDPVLQFKDNGAAKLFGYPAGSWGPLEADSLMQRDQKQWRYPCKNLSTDGETCEL